MRRNILIIISFLTLLVSSGCTNLDEKWYSEVTPDTYFTSKETVYSFLVRSFTHWRWFHGFDRAILQECTTDEMCVTPDKSSLQAKAIATPMPTPRQVSSLLG